MAQSQKYLPVLSLRSNHESLRSWPSLSMSGEENPDPRRPLTPPQIPGVRKLISADPKFAWIWCILLLFSLSGLTYGLVNISIQFYNEPTASLMRVEPPREFPDVIYCPKLWASPSKLKLFNIDAHLYAYIDSLMYQSQFSSIFEAPEIDVHLQRDRLVAKTKPKLKTLNNLIALIRYQPHDVLRSAEKKQIDYVRSELKLVENLAGGCIALVPNGTGVEPRPGYLRIIVRFEDLKSSFDLDARIASGSSGRGSIFVGSRAMAPYPEGGFTIDSSLDYNIQLEPKFIERISTRSFKCKKYTPALRSQCIIDCYNQLFMDKGLNCTFYNPNGRVRVDDPEQLCSRLDRYFFEFWYFLDLSVCDKTCMIPCRQSSYTLTAFSQKSVNHSNRSYLSMYFADAQNAVFVSETRIYTLNNFLSNLGGLVSLFLGASILSVGHLFWYFCVMPVVKMGRNKKSQIKKWRQNRRQMRLQQTMRAVV